MPDPVMEVEHKSEKSRLTRAQYASGLAAQMAPHDIERRDLLARMIDRDLSRSYTRLGVRKMGY